MRVHSEIDSVCLCVPRSSNEYRDFVFYVWCYTSMDSSQQALQTNEKYFQNFKFVFELMAEKYSNE